MSILKLIKSDSSVKKLKKMLEQSVYSVDFQAYEDEIVTIQKTRMIRSTNEKQFARQFEETIIGNSLENTRNRARLSELHLELSLKANKLRSHMKDMQKYLSATYGGQLRKAFKTVKEREVAIDSLLHEASSRLSEFESLIKTIEFILVDIDKAGFGLNQIISTAEIKSRNRQMKIK